MASELKMARAFRLGQAFLALLLGGQRAAEEDASAGGQAAPERSLLLVGLGPGHQRVLGRVAEVLGLRSLDAHAPVAELATPQLTSGGLARVAVRAAGVARPLPSSWRSSLMPG